MSEVKHTPGEWSSEVYPDGSFVIRGPDGGVLCQRSPWSARSEESRANGHVIAATPEMLEALKALVAAHDALHVVLADGPEVPGFDPTALGKAQQAVLAAEVVARAVIAKAEGRA